MYKGIYYLSALIGLLTTPDVAVASPWELAVNLGIAQYTMGSSTYQITTTETDTLRQTNNPWVGEMGIGLNHMGLPILGSKLWFGINYRYMSHDLFSHYTVGQVAQYQESEMENYTYKLTARNNRVLLDLMLPLTLTQNISMFPIAGVGYGRTSLKYSDVPNLGIYEGNLVLATQHKSSVIPEVGFGFFYQYSQNLKISLQYLYTWLGSMNTSSVGRLSGVQASLVSPAHFSLNNNALLVGLSFSL